MDIRPRRGALTALINCLHILTYPWLIPLGNNRRQLWTQVFKNADSSRDHLNPLFSRSAPTAFQLTLGVAIILCSSIQKLFIWTLSFQKAFIQCMRMRYCFRSSEIFRFCSRLCVTSLKEVLCLYLLLER